MATNEIELKEIKVCEGELDETQEETTSFIANQEKG